MTTKYLFDDPFTSSTTTSTIKKKHSKTRSDGSSSVAGSENGSLTYSVASGSVQSGGEESTDASSFADMMRILDNEDVASYIRREQQLNSGASTSSSLPQVKYGFGTPQYHFATTGRNAGSNRSLLGDGGATVDTRSVAGESLAYSTDVESHALRSLQTDAESALHGTDLLSTFTGHLSANQLNNTNALSMKSYNAANASMLNKDLEYTDEGDEPDLFNDVLFAPAEYTDGIKRRKEKKRRERREERNKRMQQQQSTSDSTLVTSNASATIPSSSTDATMRVTNSKNSGADTTELQRTNSNSKDATNSKDGAGKSGSAEPTASGIIDPMLPSGNSSANTAVPGSQESSVSSASPPRNSPKNTENKRQRSHTINNTRSSTIEMELPDAETTPWWLSCFPDTVRNLISTKQ